jgi:hypothetical protein
MEPQNIPNVNRWSKYSDIKMYQLENGAELR